MKIQNNLSRWTAVAVLAALLPTILAKQEDTSKKRVAKQIHNSAAVIDSDEDHKAAETGFGAAGIGGHGKYFQDIYVKQTGPMQLEFGHVCENDDEWEQRFERKDLAKNQHQGQVRWGDKHGGYGEHYYDYNHDGHAAPKFYLTQKSEDFEILQKAIIGGDGGGDGADGGYSEPVPEYQTLHGKTKRQSVKEERGDSGDQSAAASQTAQKRSARAPVDVTKLVFDVASGLVINEETGQAFKLDPIH